MKKNSPWLGGLVLLIMVSWPVPGTSGQTKDELPLHTEKLSDKVLFAWVGDRMQTIRVVALSTARGIVVIETNLIRSADVRIRRAVEKAFGRADFKYLINTHYHHDHTCGNQVYADATIIGHETVPELSYLSKKATWDLTLILENWGRIVESGREIRHVNMAHSDMRLSVETFKEQHRYLRTLWDGLSEMRHQGATLEDAKRKFTIGNDFPHFRDRILKVRDTNIHENNIEAIWEKLAEIGR